MCKYTKFISSLSVFFAGILYICRKLTLIWDTAYYSSTTRTIFWSS